MKIWLVAFALLTPVAFGQGILRAGESSFEISVRGGKDVAFHGSCLATRAGGDSITTKLDGVVPSDSTPLVFKVVGTAVYLTVQNLTGGKEPEVRVDGDGQRVLDTQSPAGQAGPFLEVSISKNGSTLKTQRTDAPHGVISLTTAPAAIGAPIQTELQVESPTIRFAFLTFTSETGDIEQQLVPLPFRKVFYPREGSIVNLSAQKMLVTRRDRASVSEGNILVDDGRSGTLHVTIRVNGSVLVANETSDPLGVASAATPIP